MYVKNMLQYPHRSFLLIPSWIFQNEIYHYDIKGNFQKKVEKVKRGDTLTLFFTHLLDEFIYVVYFIGFVLKSSTRLKKKCWKNRFFHRDNRYPVRWIQVKMCAFLAALCIGYFRVQSNTTQYRVWEGLTLPRKKFTVKKFNKFKAKF